MNKIKKKIDNRLLIFLLLFIITICGISYSKMRKKTLLTFGTEKEFISPQYSLKDRKSVV